MECTLGIVLFTGLAAAADDPKPQAAKEKEQPLVKKEDQPPAEVDVGKTTERIVTGAKEASKRLGNKDSGTETQQIQKDVLKNLDDLIRKAQEPPPPMSGDSSSSSSSSDMNKGGSNAKQPMDNHGGPSSSAGRQERREKRQRQENAAGRSSSQPSPLSQRQDSRMGTSSAGPPSNKFEPAGGTIPRLPDVYKDVWGHLPEKMRQEMDLYFREQFMPRYSELLRQYYSSLAESGSKGGR
jgi:hypothetical protein